MSLRSRVALLVVVAFSAVLLVVGVVVPRLVRDYLIRELDEQLDQARFAAPGLVLVRDGDNGPSPFGRGPVATYAGAYVEARTADGTLISGGFVDATASEGLAAPDLPDSIDPAIVDLPFTVSGVGDSDTSWRVLVLERPPFTGGFGGTAQGGPVAEVPPELSDLPEVSEAGLVSVALPTSAIEATVDQVVRIELIAGVISVSVLAGAAWVLVGIGLAPLRRMERTAAAVSGADQLDQRVEHPSDRTELGRLGATLNRMLARLQTSFETQQSTEARLRRFVSDASHELRTPLTSIRGYAELYRRGGDERAQVEVSMARIEHEATRMSRLVDDLLALARLDEGSAIETSTVDLRALVDGLVADAQVVAPDRRITVEGSTRCVAEVDRFRLAQAVANLLTNARLHTPATTPIEVLLDVHDEGASIAVVDHGPGLASEAADRIFDRFYRADPSRSRQQGGSGLGLAITAAIAQAHGGSVDATSTPGGGATFTIRIPKVSRSGSR